MLQGNEELYTLVDKDGHPVYTDDGMDGHFVKVDSFGSMLTFTKKFGFSQMMELARWSQTHRTPPRIAVFPARVKLQIDKIPIQ